MFLHSMHFYDYKQQHLMYFNVHVHALFGFGGPDPSPMENSNSLPPSISNIP